MTGIVTIAVGKRRYIDMARSLAMSLIVTNPGIPRAVISDAPESELTDLFDIYIPYDPSYGSGFMQKLNLDLYTPFEKTIFIDADSLSVGSLTDTMALCDPHSFVVFGGKINSGEWYMDVAQICKRFNVPSIPLFNGGVYYFKNDRVVKNIFATARKLRDQYAEIGMENFRGMLADEPLIAVAMALNRVEAVDDKGSGMRTPIGMTGPLKVDVLNEVCAFNKDGMIVEPAIMHFAGDFAEYFHYKRECAKLRVSHKFSFLNKRVVSFFVNLAYNTSYASYIFAKRIAKIILRRQKFDFSIGLPVFPNH